MSKGCLPEPRCGKSYDDLVIQLRCVLAKARGGRGRHGEAAARLEGVAVLEPILAAESGQPARTDAVRVAADIFSSTIRGSSAGEHLPRAILRKRDRLPGGECQFRHHRGRQAWFSTAPLLHSGVRLKSNSPLSSAPSLSMNVTARLIASRPAQMIRAGRP